jgi:Rrf2 family iron-sulfur cluster assembly transcriptional regulator
MISRTSEYAIRAVAYLGTLEGRPWKLSREIAAELGMPPPFLGKVLQTMAAVGIVESQRGRGGGFRLLRPPQAVTLYEIVEPIDHLGDRKMCVLGQKLCGDDHACPLHHAWKKTRETFLAALRKTTLADVERVEFPGSFPWNVKPAGAVKGRPGAKAKTG